MVKPALIVMAAGIGSRYGGLKQIDPVGPGGEIILDYSIHDALKAGFGKVVFIVTEEIEKAFREIIGKRIEKMVDTRYVFQNLGDVPAGFALPMERKKPWGTGHAVMSCRGAVDTPFAVINADDFYGASTFQILHDYLAALDSRKDDYSYCMVGFQLEKTLSENGHVARGICSVDENNYLMGIHERTRIKKFPDGAKYTEDNETWIGIPEGSTVSMNTWGFSATIFKELEAGFPLFLQQNTNDILKAEFFLPAAVDKLLCARKATVKVLPSLERWYGITYREDKPVLEKAIIEMIRRGIYSERLWEGYR